MYWAYLNNIEIPANLFKQAKNLYDFGHSPKSAFAYFLTYRKDDLIQLKIKNLTT